MLGATALGFYVLAANLAAWPVTIFSRPVAASPRPRFRAFSMTRRPCAGASCRRRPARRGDPSSVPDDQRISGAADRIRYGVRWLYAAQGWCGFPSRRLGIFFELTYDYSWCSPEPGSSSLFSWRGASWC